LLEAMGVEGFAERARRELRATGETARKLAMASRDEDLTAQVLPVPEPGLVILYAAGLPVGDVMRIFRRRDAV
jgi:hypothetical protein